ncbi:MAG: ComF family protein [Deltaproteobacteria bacterium]|nr:ComF family protein [Deltaproteobacteria bacterium]
MNLFNRLMDVIYPPRCSICREFLFKDPLMGENRSLSFCRTCYADFREIDSPLCPICSRPFYDGVEEDHLCEECLRKRPFYDAALVPYLYQGALMKAVHQFKYGAKAFLAASLGPLLAQFAQRHVKASNDFLTMPVPLHPRRLRQRGFNQSLLLARHLAEGLDTDLDFLSLRRVKYTLPQTGLGKEERRKNMRNAFRLMDPKAAKGKFILLVDDVATTGNTLNACAKALKRSGARKVLCLVLAKAGSF